MAFLPFIKILNSFFIGHWFIKHHRMCSVFRKGTLMDKKIFHVCIISLLTKCEQSVQTPGLTIKVKTRALHLSHGFWPGKIIILHSGRNAYYSSPGKAGLIGVAVLMAAHRVPPGTLPCKRTPHLGCRSSASPTSRSVAH